MKKTLMSLAVLTAVGLGIGGLPSKAEAHGRYYRPAYPAYRSYYYSAPVVYSRPVVYSAPVVYPAPVVYSSPVVYSTYSRPVYYSRPYYYGPSYFNFGYFGGSRHGGVAVRVGF
jgi:hypothetical protein